MTNLHRKICYSALAVSFLLLGCDKKSAEKEITAIKIIPPAITLASGETTELMIEATLDEGGKVVLSNVATWSSKNTDVATIDTIGQVRALAAGTSEMIARIDSGSKNISASIVVTVAKDLTIELPVAVALTATPIQLRAFFTDESGKKVDYTDKATWTNSDSDIATITTSGLFTGNMGGDTNVKAEFVGDVDTYMGTLDITVLSQAEAKELNIKTP